MAYSVADRAIALEVMARHGGMTWAALADIEAALGRRVSKSTLHAWAKANEPNEPNAEPNAKKNTLAVAPEARREAADTLDDLFEQVARRYLKHAGSPAVVMETRGRDAVIAAATAVDKMRLLRGLPTEIVALTVEVVQALDRAGLSAADVFNGILMEVRQREQR